MLSGHTAQRWSKALRAYTDNDDNDAQREYEEACDARILEHFFGLGFEKNASEYLDEIVAFAIEGHKTSGMVGIVYSGDNWTENYLGLVYIEEDKAFCRAIETDFGSMNTVKLLTNSWDRKRAATAVADALRKIMQSASYAVGGLGNEKVSVVTFGGMKEIQLVTFTWMLPGERG